MASAGPWWGRERTIPVFLFAISFALRAAIQHNSRWSRLILNKYIDGLNEMAEIVGIDHPASVPTSRSRREACRTLHRGSTDGTSALLPGEPGSTRALTRSTASPATSY